jgi:hypothetical protein
MGYELPRDVVLEVKRKHPNIVDMDRVIDDIFNEIVEKTFKDGACQIKNLGKYQAFQSFSTRNNKNVLKFKFTCSYSFKKKFKDDVYLIESLPIKANVPFTEDHEKKCNREIKLANDKACNDAFNHSKKKTKDRLAKHEILDILNSGD